MSKKRAQHKIPLTTTEGMELIEAIRTAERTDLPPSDATLGVAALVEELIKTDSDIIIKIDGSKHEG